MIVAKIHKFMAYTQNLTCLYHLRFKSKHNHLSVPEQKQGLRFQKHDAKRRAMSEFLRMPFSCRNKNMAVYTRALPEDSSSLDPSPNHWNVWIFILGTIFSLLLSFSRGKWGPLLLLKEKVETTIEEAEHVADIVEEVAEGVDKVVEDVVSLLPKGKLRDAAQFVEKVAEDIDKYAENAEDALEKVENMEKKLESFVESTTEDTIMPPESKDQK